MHVPLKVGLSSMEGAGRGMLVEGNVPAHSWIFSSMIPLCNIVSVFSLIRLQQNYTEACLLMTW